MDWKTLKQRFVKRGVVATASFTLPSVVLEIQPDFVAGTRLATVKHQREVHGVRVAPLPPQSVNPHAGRNNVANAEALREAVAAVTSALGNGSDRFGLLLSDASTRVSVLAFETLPEDHHEAEALVRWRLAENLPFAAEEARIHYQVLLNQPGHVEILAAAGRDSVLAEYEALLGPTNGIPALVLPSTMALLPLVPERHDAGQLVLHLCCRWLTAVVVVGNRVCFWRTRDHARVEVSEIWLCARPAAPAGLRQELGPATGCEVKELAPAPELGSLLAAEEKEDFERYGAVAAGLVQNAALGQQPPA